VSDSSPASASPPSLGAITKVLVIIIACIGFLFDTYELLMFPVIGADSVAELIQANQDGTSPGWIAELGFDRNPDLKRGVPPASDAVRRWAGSMLWIAALTGGTIGLLGGWLIDRLGRKTIMVAAILAYSLSPVAAAYSTELWQLVLFRSTTFAGVCVEMVAAVTWLAELFVDKRTRELVIGWTLATASLGGILVTEAYNLIVELVHSGGLPDFHFPAGHVPGNIAWRVTLLTGLIPGAAILLLMPFVPESQIWKRKKREGTLKRASFRELFSGDLLRTTIATTVLSACGYAAAFGAIQMTPLQIVAGLPDIARMRVEAAKEMEAAQAAVKGTSEGTPERGEATARLDLAKKGQGAAAQELKARRGNIQRWQELGGLAGRILLAVLLLFVPSKTLIRLFLVPGIVLLPVTYLVLVHKDYSIFAMAIFGCGLLTVAQFSFLSEFLPRVYPLHLRGTGGSFATNFGGRMIGTMAAFLNTGLISTMFDATPPMQVAKAAAVIGGGAFVIAFFATFLLPAPHAEVEKQAATLGADEARNEPKSETVD
jgi:MFS family permease